MKKYDNLSSGFTSLDSARKSMATAYGKYADAAVSQLAAMREFGSLIFRLEHVADLMKFGDTFTDEDGVLLSAGKRVKALATFYRDTVAIPDNSFISESRARGLAMFLLPEWEATVTREQFKRIASIFRSKRTHGDMKSDATEVWEEATKLADGGDITGEHVAQAMKNTGNTSTRNRATVVTPADSFLASVASVGSDIEEVHAITVAALPDADRELLRATSDALVRLLDNADTVLANIASDIEDVEEVEATN